MDSIVKLPTGQHCVSVFFDILSGLFISATPAANLRAVKPVPVVIAAAPCAPALPIAVSPVQLAAIIARNTLRLRIVKVFGLWM